METLLYYYEANIDMYWIDAIKKGLELIQLISAMMHEERDCTTYTCVQFHTWPHMHSFFKLAVAHAWSEQTAPMIVGPMFTHHHTSCANDPMIGGSTHDP